MIINSSSIIRNRQKDKFFGIDYYANLCHGSNPIFNYLSTPLDFYPLANQKASARCLDRELDFLKKINDFEEDKIFGIFENPDIYTCHDSIFNIIDKLKETRHGLFIETNSLNLINDIEVLEDFSKTNPLLIGIPISSYSSIDLSIFNEHYDFKSMEKLIKALEKTDIKFGFIMKPFIPEINDDPLKFKELLETLIHHHPDFIYPTFSLNFDSKKLNEFYDLIDKEKPEFKSKYFDKYGYKKSWISDRAEELKKIFIFNIKKTKIAYSMNQIIDLYKTTKQQEQISLF
ncbi:hypothetical protein HF295_02035 [Hujiaoplasma nucleasis]|uniref:Radical SAM protein n=1 Tax=Hujiaoplasma nucleasis TaxID=2725268 RepID=A0A7L6N2B4_9MOLU|nr:hypothetical protein [Hujiaoplasma nucleasis]QLY39701.1 hypothetical protein HF295_02035 [Hujiaoplasma nucleasis]